VFNQSDEGLVDVKRAVEFNPCLSNYSIAISQEPECLSAVNKLSNSRIPIWDSWPEEEGTTEVDIFVF
jgi:hypothetical protein